MDPRLRWLAIFSVPFVLVLGFAAWAAWPTVAGESILLSTAPVDPPDLLRGDYVDLRYNISTVTGARGYTSGDPIYVLLRPGSDYEPGTGRPYWEIASHARTTPNVPAGMVCLAGTVQHVNTSTATVQYGIESYFIQKDEDLHEWRGKEVSVEVKVAGCTGRVTEIHLDGERWEG